MFYFKFKKILSLIFIFCKNSKFISNIFLHHPTQASKSQSSSQNIKTLIHMNFLIQEFSIFFIYRSILWKNIYQWAPHTYLRCFFLVACTLQLTRSLKSTSQRDEKCHKQICWVWEIVCLIDCNVVMSYSRLLLIFKSTRSFKSPSILYSWLFRDEEIYNNSITLSLWYAVMCGIK